MTGWTWASTDDVNGLLNFYIGSEQLGPGPDSFSDMDEDFTELSGWRFFYVEEEPNFQGGNWRPMQHYIESGLIRTDGLTSTPLLSRVIVVLNLRSYPFQIPGTSVTTGWAYQDYDKCGLGCLGYGPRAFQGAWFFRTP
jgi:hypothetical protein